MPAATRSGKTAFIPIAINVIAQIFNRKIKVLVTEPTNEMVRRVLFREYVEGIYSPWAKIFPDGRLIKSEKIWECQAARVYFAGMDIPERIEGINYDLVCMDELFQCREEALQIAISRTGQTEGYCFFGSTPYHKRTWYRKWIPRKLDDPEWKVIHVTAYDLIKTEENPSGIFSAKELERQRKELPDWLFRQRYMADWNAKPEGIIYEIPIEQICVSDEMSFARYYAGLDFGESKGHPAACVLMGQWYNGKQFIIGEFKKPCKGDKAYDKELTKMCERMKIKKKDITIYADDSRPGQIHALRTDYGWKIQPAKKGRVLDGISATQSAIKEGLTFHANRCSDLITECESYCMNDSLKEPAPYKTDDDLCDALRYLIISTKRTKLANSISSGIEIYSAAEARIEINRITSVRERRRRVR